ncbi:trafficking regulator of GLUT4 1-like [Rhineura floridana]|uniref:trafficking regulator of GLUT4 1-like n=1 Tax=Rhineura floridana TaxID=261503 RepID=UPI002AC80A66|nr:trafficking regulator of GLUT4 1-like [Rhineura floridana]
MAINTQASLEKALEGSPPPVDSQKKEKLLAAVGQAPKAFLAGGGDDGAPGETERNGHHSLPYQSGLEGKLEDMLLSLLRLSLGHVSSTATTSNLQEPGRLRDYLPLATLSCFCPIWPLNILALVFSVMGSI